MRHDVTRCGSISLSYRAASAGPVVVAATRAAQLLAPLRGGGQERAHGLQVRPDPQADADRHGHGPPHGLPPDLRLRHVEAGRDLAEDALERAEPALHP